MWHLQVAGERIDLVKSISCSRFEGELEDCSCIAVQLGCQLQRLLLCKCVLQDFVHCAHLSTCDASRSLEESTTAGVAIFKSGGKLFMEGIICSTSASPKHSKYALPPPHMEAFLSCRGWRPETGAQTGR